MILKNLQIWNFRKFSHYSEKPGLEIELHKGINVLIGENDSGKTAIIDAVKILLQTQSNDIIHISEEDFYCDEQGNSENEFRIECTFSDFKDDEAKNFIEWLQFTQNADGTIDYSLKVQFRAWKEKNRIFSDFRAGMNEEGNKMDGRARDLLKCTYLRPLRDAAREMHSGRNTRISQILYSHPVFLSKDEHEIVTILKEANSKLEEYFSEGDGKEVLGSLKNNLGEFLDNSSKVGANFVTSNLKLKSILESLSLDLSELQPGLGVQNLLFIAAELILLNTDDNGGLKLALIEEIEAHLHPQAQLRLIDYIQKEYDNSGVQFIISTHSTTLASKINIKNEFLCKGNRAFSLSPQYTKLLKGDYLFLQRFIDSSKSNLFFAQGIIMVEGDAENILLPTIASLIEIPLSKNGISIVNVGSTAFLRYSNIFKQSNNEKMGIPVSIVTDCDIIPEIIDGELDIKRSATEQKIKDKEDMYSEGDIKAFIAPHWTFEYSIALSNLKKWLYRAILYAEKIQNSDKYALTNDKIVEVDKKVTDDFNLWRTNNFNHYQIAYEIYNNTLLKKDISKAITAQCLASIMQYSILKKNDDITKETMFDSDLYQKTIDIKKKKILQNIILKDKYTKYFVNAIKYAAKDEVLWR